MTSVLVVRGHLATPWELRPWLELEPRFEVSYLRTRSNRYVPPPGLRAIPVRALRDLLPGGRLGEIATGVLGDRYLAATAAFARSDIVHAAELSFWFSAEAARLRGRHRFRLVQTVWETLPMLSAYRNHHARRYRERVLAATDLFLPVTERAAIALALEGVPPERMVVTPPGIDLERFGPPASTDVPPGSKHVLVSPGRLVWEKGHQDVIRALALLHRGLARPPSGEVIRPRLVIVGSGPEGDRLRAHAAELGIGDAVTVTSVPYEEMPGIFHTASALVLASQATATSAYHLFDIPRVFWEEQFGMVFAEAMAARLAIVTTTSGAIPEVLAGSGAALVAPGDWPALARALAGGPLSRPPGARVEYPEEAVRRYSSAAAALRLAAAYDQALALPAVP